MKMIILPIRDITRTFTDSLLRGFMETRHPYLGDLLARHAPRTSVKIGEVKTYQDYHQVSDELHRELQPFNHGLVGAIFDESLATMAAWGGDTVHHTALEDYLRQNLFNWDDQRLTQSCQFLYDRFIDPLAMDMQAWFAPRIRDEPWLMWHYYWFAGDMVIEPGVDYRVADWMRTHQSFHGEVNTNDAVAENDFDLINQYILDDNRKHRSNALQSITNYIQTRSLPRLKIASPEPRLPIGDQPLVVVKHIEDEPTPIDVTVDAVLDHSAPPLRLLDLIGHDAGNHPAEQVADRRGHRPGPVQVHRHRR